MRLRLHVCLDPATTEQGYADDCRLSNVVGTDVVTVDGSVVGKLVDAWVEDGSLYGEIEIETAEGLQHGLDSTALMM